jgi:Ca2+-transporting ATPase
MITGDNGLTAAAIAKKIGIPVTGSVLTGTQLDAMDEKELQEAVRDVNIFSRVVPEHKLRIVKAFQANGEIVAMTGDGVNDAPALKHADIGIAMGKRGSEVAREAADLILLDDNFNTIVETVRDGRRIYDNIRKAVGYVMTIHIPIVLASLLAPLLGIAPMAYMLLPLQVVLLEVIIDPTCSIVLERQPAEANIMERLPRNINENLLTKGLLGKSLLQGFCIFAVSFGAYYFTLAGDAANSLVARTVGLTIIVLANQFLVLVNSSTTMSAYQSCKLLADDKIMWAINTTILLLLAVIIYSPVAAFFKLAPLSVQQLLLAIVLAAISVFWYELVKLAKNY